MQVFLPLNCWGAKGLQHFCLTAHKTLTLLFFSVTPISKNQLLSIYASGCMMETNLWDFLPNHVYIY